MGLTFQTYGQRFYTHYCPHGSLDSVISPYTQSSGKIDPDGYVSFEYPAGTIILTSRQRAMDSYIPEAFIWLVLRNMADALYQMNYSAHYYMHDTLDVVMPNWSPLQHLDIKNAK